MKKTNLLILLIFLFIVSCGNVGKILRNEKIKSTDEFLVKKKEPLVLPPDYSKIPEPGSLSKKKESENEDRIKKILLTVTDPGGLIGQDTVLLKIINDEAPVADAGIDFVAPFNRRVYIDGTRTTDKDSKIIYDWSIISGDASFSKEESKKQSPYFLYPSEINKSRIFIALLKVRDKNSYCFSQDTVKVTCLPNVDTADKNVKYEILRASKEDNKVFVDLNVTNKQSWPLTLLHLLW